MSQIGIPPELRTLAPQLSPSALARLVVPDPERGTFFWLPRERSLFKTELTWVGWNKIHAWQPAFLTNSHGYRQARILHRSYLAHRAMWALVHDEWPVGCIDHVNGNRADNRIVNLRLVAQSENCLNASRRRDNTSGVTGVSFDRRRSQWRAHIQLNGRFCHLGAFEHFDDAVAARKAAATRLGFHENHGRAA